MVKIKKWSVFTFLPRSKQLRGMCLSTKDISDILQIGPLSIYATDSPARPPLSSKFRRYKASD